VPDAPGTAAKPGTPGTPSAPGTPEPYDGLKGILHFVPWGGDGISLDLMRRDRSADPGLNELLIVATLQAAASLRVRRVSLNFAMFRSVLARGERLGAGPVLRGWRNTLVFLSRWFQIESLYRFNAKFQPRWEPRSGRLPGRRPPRRLSPRPPRTRVRPPVAAERAAAAHPLGWEA
jgi:lysyl-tRNA synthetase class 2